jgi:hypothetical protein
MSGLVLCLAIFLPILAAKPLDSSRTLETGEDHASADKADRIRAGMTAAEVQELLGPPTRTARQILYRRYLEQWRYADRPGFWIDFDCRRGREARVTAIHLPAPAE